MTIIAKNLTGSPINLIQLSIPDSQVPASGQVTLTDYNTRAEIIDDAELRMFVDNNILQLNNGIEDLTRAQGMAYLMTPEGIKHNVASVDPGENDDQDAGYTRARSTWYNDVSKAVFLCKDDTPADAAWQDVSSGPPPALSNTMQIVVGKDSNSTSYETLLEFEYGGSASWGLLTQVTVISSRPSNSYDLRIYDAMNALVIAELLGLINTSSAIDDMGTLQNIPTGQTIFEMQARRVGGGAGNRVAVNSMSLKF